MQDKPIYVPTSTYRLQIHHAFPLTAARDVVPYLAHLGVAACYTSPYFTAAPASTHGYDVCNHNEINPEVGGTKAHDEFSAALAQHGMRHIVDFVPNHMGVGTGRNSWWTDVLENGASSPAAAFFDIDWRPVKATLHAKLLLPILGDQYGSVLERGELRITFTGSSLVLKYFDQELPINPRQAARVYAAAADRLKAMLGEETPSLNEFLSIVTSLQNLPPHTTTDPDQIAELHREKEVARRRLERLVADEPAVQKAIEGGIEEINGIPGQSSSFDALHDLLEAQPYRLAYWRTASHEINYRRFFDINTLVGLRVERDEVFEATHQLLAQLIAEGKVHAVRVDHPDGLFDPAKYFFMLQELAARALGVHINDAAGSRAGRPLYVLAEKILSGSERLPPGWAVHGTTGYNFLNDLNGVFIDVAQARRMRRVYAKLTGHSQPFDDVLYASKRLIMGTAMASELNVLAHTLERIGEGNRKSRDFTLDSLRDVITEFIACFPVYRTYVDERGWTTEDRAVVVRAIARARRRNPAMESSLFDFLREVVLPRDVRDEGEPRAGVERRVGYPPADEQEARARMRFSMKLQQYTGPVQAKGLEDTAFYRYNVLLSLNEVGGDPSRFGRSVEEFHEANRLRAEAWPFEMLATATHDTKLGEDVRARINVLSEIPDEWGREVSKWMRIAKPHRTLVDGDAAPDRTDEYRFYQALIGVWPPDLDEHTNAAPDELIARLSEYMIKAVKEAKVHTSWLTPNEPYEDALRAFVRHVLSGSGGAKLLAAMLPFQRKVAHLGMMNSLAQVTLKIGSPGVPDFFQGTDLWDLSLVDPDNRRPVDFARRSCLLKDVERALASDSSSRGPVLRNWLEHWIDGRIKMLVTMAGLRLRRELPDVFLGGEYLPIPVELTASGSALAFARLSPRRDQAVLFVAPRLFSRLVTPAQPVPIGGDCWKTSRLMLPPELRDRQFRDEITGAEIRPTRASETAWIFVGEAFQTLPVAMLRAV
ncbi:MAG TPA: malto-oligosyltrehalose synthase [Vicinamibacterales bacterium]|jgi:(1->4)-alpha-D-glucan 1-alpha-D-glucosylmutase|nr:malto-oligosyltrehalose synthase [Vicinamibacterales bacterium]